MNPENIKKDIQPKENFFKEIVKFIFIALIIVIPVRTYIAQPFIVSGPSMDPTFKTGQYLIVDQVSYRFGNPSRGDVIVFKYPRDPKTFYIKRIIGLPNETVMIDKGKVTIVNSENPKGFELEDDYISNTHKTTETFQMNLDGDEYFVMGDNRAESSDSRIWGALNEEFIVGRPILRLLPISKVSLFPGKI